MRPTLRGLLTLSLLPLLIACAGEHDFERDNVLFLENPNPNPELMEPQDPRTFCPTDAEYLGELGSYAACQVPGAGTVANFSRPEGGPRPEHPSQLCPPNWRFFGTQLGSTSVCGTTEFGVTFSIDFDAAERGFGEVGDRSTFCPEAWELVGDYRSGADCASREPHSVLLMTTEELHEDVCFPGYQFVGSSRPSYSVCVRPGDRRAFEVPEGAAFCPEGTTELGVHFGQRYCESEAPLLLAILTKTVDGVRVGEVAEEDACPAGWEFVYRDTYALCLQFQ